MNRRDRKMGVPVKCRMCGWRSQRRCRPCEIHDDACSCSAYGVCPKCGGRVSSLEWIRNDRKAQLDFQQKPAEKALTESRGESSI
jgi:hypothetical protein